MEDPTKRDMLAASATATALGTTPALFAQQSAQSGVGTRFYKKSQLRIAWQEAGSGIPLLLVAWL